MRALMSVLLGVGFCGMIMLEATRLAALFGVRLSIAAMGRLH